MDDIISKPRDYEDLGELEDYSTLVLEAHKAGLKVVGLDDKLSGHSRTSTSEIYAETPRWLYRMLLKREKSWIEKLRGTRADSVVVMHPAHAAEVSRELGLPKSNIDTKNGIYDRHYRHRKELAEVAKKYADEIGRKRLERRLLRSSSRLEQRKRPKR